MTNVLKTMVKCTVAPGHSTLIPESTSNHSAPVIPVTYIIMYLVGGAKYVEKLWGYFFKKLSLMV